MAPSAILSLLLLLSSFTAHPIPTQETLPDSLLSSTTNKGGIFGQTREKVKIYKDPLVTSNREKKYYNPNFGYEGYWVNGEWLIRDPIKDLPPNTTTPKIPLVCGEECSYIYRTIYQVCAVQGSKYWLPSCKGQECYGEYLTDITHHYKTFDTYCAFLDAQCREDYYGRWDLIHRGPCVHPSAKYFLDIVNVTAIVNRKDAFLAAVQINLDNVVTIRG